MITYGHRQLLKGGTLLSLSLLLLFPRTMIFTDTGPKVLTSLSAPGLLIFYSYKPEPPAYISFRISLRGTVRRPLFHRLLLPRGTDPFPGKTAWKTHPARRLKTLPRQTHPPDPQIPKRSYLSAPDVPSAAQEGVCKFHPEDAFRLLIPKDKPPGQHHLYIAASVVSSSSQQGSSGPE